MSRFSDKTPVSTQTISTGDDATALRLKKASVALGKWSTEASQADQGWDGSTAANKDAAMRQIVRRFGILCTHLADLINENT